MFIRNLSKFPRNYQKLQIISKRASSTTSKDADIDSKFERSACIGMLIGSFVGAYQGGKGWNGRRDVAGSAFGAITGGLGGAVAGLFWPFSLVCCGAIGAAYAIDNIPVKVNVEYKISNALSAT